VIRLYCATGNPGKLAEFQLAARIFDIAIEHVPNFGTLPACEETGSTFEENAILKARHYAATVDGLVFADDSGLAVNALGGAPGVYSARYSGPNASDEANNRLLLENLRGDADRTASFVCAIALVAGAEVRGVFHGSVEGTILDGPRGSAGFGYDPLFYYAPFGCTFGEASEERKFEVSHRGEAFRAMLAYLRTA
jgi:XTP/dITP diphosphohydrolase